MKATAPGGPSHPPLPPSPALKQGGAHPPAQRSLPHQVPSTRTPRAAVTGLLLGPDAGAGTLDLGTGDDALVTHADGAGAVGRHPATAFRMLLPMSKAAWVPGRQV